MVGRVIDSMTTWASYARIPIIETIVAVVAAFQVDSGQLTLRYVR